MGAQPLPSPLSFTFLRTARQASSVFSECVCWILIMQGPSRDLLHFRLTLLLLSYDSRRAQLLCVSGSRPNSLSRRPKSRGQVAERVFSRRAPLSTLYDLLCHFHGPAVFVSTRAPAPQPPLESYERGAVQNWTSSRTLYATLQLVYNRLARESQ